MARLSDIIEEFIKDMFEENNKGELQIQRNELANYFSCAPSQINYVLTTRFTTEKGYYIESKRGGGGYITIKRVEFNENTSLAEVINEKIGEWITYDKAIKIIEGLLEARIINNREAALMKVAINDRNLGSEFGIRNKIRANILKAMIMVVLSLNV
ncbi:transcriptional regulator CtsR [Clostridium acetireducens DSM 10703]|jgi:transcriptional regulator CtsR|uniref:Transcriptional regulator CtsR n=1 Tax=Clostridium acetireducens DSM 10703 TaxID=1121290 RepID=A0A1E8F185_9CLOT|nr:CtsR family transcriptional regulator [Clostridium acetireducens]OFI06927.1 transcriptional regulator CtsR [Clostridium acetireducens DSM 10703]